VLNQKYPVSAGAPQSNFHVVQRLLQAVDAHVDHGQEDLAASGHQGGQVGSGHGERR
jgi:hypothetical protein